MGPHCIFDFNTGKSYSFYKFYTIFSCKKVLHTTVAKFHASPLMCTHTNWEKITKNYTLVVLHKKVAANFAL